MSNNEQLHKAKQLKNNEFYTQYDEIEREINGYLSYNPDIFKGKVVLLPCDDPTYSNFLKYFVSNFDKFGLKKLISTSYANDSKPKEAYVQLSLFEQESPQFDKKKTDSHGKIFVMTKKTKREFSFDDLKWRYLEGDGDFRSDEVKILRDEADFIITNPPFSLFREFIAWIMEAEKKFITMGNKNAITYKEVFPYIRDNKIWTGFTSINGGRWMILPKGIEVESNSTKINKYGERIVNVPGVCWFANVEHGKRHEPLIMMTMDENLRFNKKLEDNEDVYKKYNNYNVIEVPFVEAIPSDYFGVMGVPITFMNDYNPKQFEIIGMAEDNGKGFSGKESEWDKINTHCIINGEAKYKRLFIKRII